MFTKKNLKKYLILSTALLVFSFVFFNYAKIVNACTTSDNTHYCLLAPIPGLTPSADGSIDVSAGFGDYAVRIIRIVIGLMGVLAVIMVVFGGIQYMISSSGGEKGAGKERMTNAIYGLILALSSYMILNTINPNLVNLKVTIPQGELTMYNDDDRLSMSETAAGEDLPPGPPGPVTPAGKTVALCSDYATCKALCTSTNNGTTYNGSPPPPGILDPALAVPISGIPLVSGGCRNCTASAGVISALNKLKPTIDSLIASKSIPNRSYTFQINSAYRPVKDQIRLMCANGDVTINKTVVDHTIAFPGTSKHGVGYAVDVGFSWDSKPTVNCGSAFNEGTIEKIMTAAGFARLKKEAWHFEIDITNPNTCTYPSCSQATKCSP